MRSYLLAASLLMAITPALAGEFYVGKNPKTGDCDIFDVKPDGTNLLQVGDTSYPSREAAKDARRKAPECEKNKWKFAVVDWPGRYKATWSAPIGTGVRSGKAITDLAGRVWAMAAVDYVSADDRPYFTFQLHLDYAPKRR